MKATPETSSVGDEAKLHVTRLASQQFMANGISLRFIVRLRNVLGMDKHFIFVVNAVCDDIVVLLKVMPFAASRSMLGE